MFSKATVAAGETAVFTIVVKVNAGHRRTAATITNTATAATTTTDPTPGNNTGTTTTTVQTQADLAVTKSDSPDPVVAGVNLTYTINFVNNGPSDAQIGDGDRRGAGQHYVCIGSGHDRQRAGARARRQSAEPATWSSRRRRWPRGETAVFTIVVNVNADTPNGTIDHQHRDRGGTTTDPTPGNNTGTATTTVQTQADLAVTKTDSPDPVCAGNNMTYTINFINNGPSDAQTVTVTDAVPANTTFVSAAVTTGTGWTSLRRRSGGTGNVVFSKAPVAARRDRGVHDRGEGQREHGQRHHDYQQRGRRQARRPIRRRATTPGRLRRRCRRRPILR